jgi:cysteine desulfurase / selenocysteine lyase
MNTSVASASSTKEATSRTAGLSAQDVRRLRQDFPGLDQVVHGHPLVFLDNAASSQTAQPVLDRIMRSYIEDRANIHRGVHLLSQRATEHHDAAREKVRQFMNAGSEKEIIFVRGTTEAINLVAQTMGVQRLTAGDEVLISMMEHHSNIVPWQLLCEKMGAKLQVVEMNQRGELIQESFETKLNSRTKIVALAHVSNALGTVNPVKEMISKAHQKGAIVVIDGAQAAPHMKIDVQDLDADFYAFSGHKIYGPTGIGALYGKAHLLNEMPPWQGGGDMIKSVQLEQSTWNDIPYKFEAGTPDINGAIGLGAAVDYLNQVGLDKIAEYEQSLLSYATAKLEGIAGLSMIGTAKDKASLCSFTIDDLHPHDLGTILDRRGIAVRTGHHCAQPVMEHFCVPATTRASFSFYNTFEEIDTLVDGLNECIRIMT